MLLGEDGEEAEGVSNIFSGKNVATELESPSLNHYENHRHQITDYRFPAQRGPFFSHGTGQQRYSRRSNC